MPLQFERRFAVSDAGRHCHANGAILLSQLYLKLHIVRAGHVEVARLQRQSQDFLSRGEGGEAARGPGQAPLSEFEPQIFKEGPNLETGKN